MTKQLPKATMTMVYMRDCQTTADSAMQNLACAALRAADLNLLEETLETWHDYMASWGFSDFSLWDRPVWGYLQSTTVQEQASLQITLYGIPDTQAFFGLMRFLHLHLPGGCLWRTYKRHNSLVGAAEWRKLKVEIVLDNSKFCQGIPVTRTVIEYSCATQADTED